MSSVFGHNCNVGIFGSVLSPTFSCIAIAYLKLVV